MRFWTRYTGSSFRGLGDATVQSEYYTLIEDAFLEPSESGFGTRLEDFFAALGDFSNNVEELAVREATLAEAEALAGSLNDLSDRLYLLRTNANEELRNMVPEINSIASQIANLNQRIRESEYTDQPAMDLRDDRDLLLDELGELVNMSYYESDNGEITVLVGSDILVDAAGARETGSGGQCRAGRGTQRPC